MTIEAAEGVSTGVSAQDRVTTIKAAIADQAKPTDLHRPGHVFPLRAAEGGVLARRGHTEASVDLARLSGFKPAGVICEITNDDGTMARAPEIIKFAKKIWLCSTNNRRFGGISSKTSVLIKYSENKSAVRKSIKF